MKKSYFMLVALAIFNLMSCSNDDPVMEEQATTEETSEPKVVYDEQSKLKRDFAVALAKAMDESAPLRELLKDEALKMFDNDYDVLYHSIKNEQLSDGTTVRELLVKQYENESRLSEIENNIPTLTIFVPQLPEDSFSAELWDTQNDVPQVAIKMNTTNIVPLFDQNGEERLIESGIPGFPVVVVKENERVIAGAQNSAKNKEVKGSMLSRGGMDFQFLDDVFNGTLPDKVKKELNEERATTSIDQKLITAYNTYKNVDGWHRDYIYYGLTPNNTRGQFSYDFQEHITSFSLNGGTVVSKISDQDDDPKLRPKQKQSDPTWTNGFFEFKVRVLLNAKNGLGAEYITYFSANPHDLFEYSYSRCGDRFPERLFLCPNLERLKTINLNLPLFNWDLNQYASTIKIELEEVDLAVTTTITDTRTVKFANNFSIQDGILKKIGLKFGSSLETTDTQTIQKTYTQENDHLGAVIINFADDVILNNNGGKWNTREYTTGWFKISVEPKRVQ